MTIQKLLFSGKKSFADTNIQKQFKRKFQVTFRIQSRMPKIAQVKARIDKAESRADEVNVEPSIKNDTSYD